MQGCNKVWDLQKQLGDESPRGKRQAKREVFESRVERGRDEQAIKTKTETDWLASDGAERLRSFVRAETRRVEGAWGAGWPSHVQPPNPAS